MSGSLKYFSEVSNDFEEQYQWRVDFQQRYEVWGKLIKKFSSEKYNALDLGCGTGIFTNLLAQFNANVTGLDGSYEMIKIAQSKCIENAQFICKKIEDLSFLDHQSFDLIISSSVFEYLDDIESSLHSVSQLLKPAGLLMISFPNKKSVFRIIERLSYFFLRRPAYLKHVKNMLTPEVLSKKLIKNNLEIIECIYYASQKLLTKKAPSKFEAYFNNMFVCVYKKSLIN